MGQHCNHIGSDERNFIQRHQDRGSSWIGGQLGRPGSAIESCAEPVPPSLGTVSHGTIYRAIYVLLKGELRKEIIGWLRQSRCEDPARKAGTGAAG